MNEELQQALLKMIEGFTASAQGAAEFTVDKAPEVVQQLLFYQTIKQSFFFIFLSFVFALSVYFLLMVRKQIKKETYCSDELLIGCMFLTIVAIITILIDVFIVIPRMLKLLIAPDLYVLEYAARLIQ